MTAELVNFWQAVETDKGPLYIHPEDRAWMSKHQKDGRYPPDQDTIPNWHSYLRSTRFGSTESELHLSLVPVPYVGNLQRAKIVICLANPGLADADYYAESDPAFKDALVRNLKQDADLQYPFFYLDPQFAWTPAFQWWAKRLKPQIKALIEEDGKSYSAALKLIAERVAVIELFPYHSRDVAELSGWSGRDMLPSVEIMQRYFSTLTHRKDRLTLLMRSHKLWHKEGCAGPSSSYVHGTPGRGISFDPETVAGDAMLKKLKAD